MRFSSFAETTSEAFRNAGEFLTDLATPTVRIGVTGLARAGKTVFITALVHNLVQGGRLPFFEAAARGRIKRAWLEPQPDDAVARFAYEEHLACLFADPPDWPQSTRHISELRVALEYEPTSFIRRALGVRTLHLDIVDYPGEWLLDLPLLNTSYEAWSAQALALARKPSRKSAASDWLAFLGHADPQQPAAEQTALDGARLFKAYLAACRGEGNALSTLSPGRFLLPGELDGTPALTFMPLDLPAGPAGPPRGSLWAMMERRYVSYRTHVVRPFMRDHFARLDRQIVLVDVLAALNAGPEALADLQRALTEILGCYRAGANTWATSLFARRIDRLLFAATKADHLHHTSHDRLENVLKAITSAAMARAQFAGAEVRSLALAAVRATREATARQGRETLPCIMGVPLPGERLGAQVFDGRQEIAIFPGDLPEDPAAMLANAAAPAHPAADDMWFVRFRPVRNDPDAQRAKQPLPNIRLDRALEFLVGDRLI